MCVGVRVRLSHRESLEVSSGVGVGVCVCVCV